MGLQIEIQQEEFYYTPSIGVNYYFYTTPIFTPYVGTKYFIDHQMSIFGEKKGSKYYIGGHFFITEDISISPEFGGMYEDFDTELGTYFNTFLTYFF